MCMGIRREGGKRDVEVSWDGSGETVLSERGQGGRDGRMEWRETDRGEEGLRELRGGRVTGQVRGREMVESEGWKVEARGEGERVSGVGWRRREEGGGGE
ncbi:hypothetical protein Tco_1508069 [Tanacetum coccineum]